MKFRKWSLFFTAAFLIILLASCEQGGMSSSSGRNNIPVKAPKISFDSITYDAGEVVEGTKVAHAYKFVNRGKKLLQITEVRSTCGCTVAKLDKREYNPGEGGQINVIFNSHGYSRKVIKRVIVTTNDPLNAKIYLTLNCFVKKYIDISPRLINFRDVSYNDKKTVSIFLKSDVEKEFTINKIDFPAQMKDSLSYKITKITGANSNYKIDITLAPKNANFRSFGYSIIIHTDSKNAPTIPVQIRGTITGPIQYYPQAISFYSDKDRYISYTVNFMSKTSFVIKSASFSFGQSDNYGVKVNTVKQGHIYTVSVFSKKPVTVGIHGQLNILTSVPAESRISLPLNIKVR